MEDNDNIIVPTDWVPTERMIKVVGVGGGGVNAVTYMHNNKIDGCTFIVCNTDRKSLEGSSVPIKIQLGHGRGAGTDPTKGRDFAIEAAEAIEKELFDGETEMLFITTCLGGGTGTGAAPVIASMARERGILTVAVVTLPFKNDQKETMVRAIDGIHELERYVDSLLVINNDKLYDVYGDMLIQDAFPKTDEVLATAVRAVVDIIQSKGFIIVDIEDVKKMMRNSGMALMGCGSGAGENRLEDAIRQALESPLLNDCDLKTAKNTLINITAGYNDKGLLMKELEKIDQLIEEYTGKANRFKRGIVYDYSEDFKDKVNITVIATGFDAGTFETMIEDQGNLIFVPNDFVYKRPKDEEEELSEQTSIVIKAGGIGRPRNFNFTNDNRPVLAVRRGDNIPELENMPAILRVPADRK
ncbi:MAG: cell division FtsZ family protein [Bacteroidales bacterium]|nr:cell division FtsZ family protein [Bacteroidales bacterium]